MSRLSPDDDRLAAVLHATGPWIEVAKAGRPHGVRGEVRLQVHNPASPLWQPGLVVRAWLPGRPPRALYLQAIRPAQDAWIAHFSGMGDRDAAASLTHALLQVPADTLPPAADDEFYLHELIGAAVIEAETGEVAGRVAGFVETAQTLMQVELASGGVALVPVESDAVESLGRERGRVVVRHLSDWLS